MYSVHVHDKVRACTLYMNFESANGSTDRPVVCDVAETNKLVD